MSQEQIAVLCGLLHFFCSKYMSIVGIVSRFHAFHCIVVICVQLHLFAFVILLLRSLYA